jgi:hypothetical protein
MATPSQYTNVVRYFHIPLIEWCIIRQLNHETITNEPFYFKVFAEAKKNDGARLIDILSFDRYATRDAFWTIL